MTIEAWSCHIKSPSIVLYFTLTSGPDFRPESSTDLQCVKKRHKLQKISTRQMNYQQSIDEAAKWAEQYITQQRLENFFFHDLSHTAYVVKATQRIAHHYQLLEEEYYIVTVAAYFHDLGYFSGGSDHHEQRSVEIAKKYLTSVNVPDHLIQAISNCILATQIPQKPTNLLESILCDADLFHLGEECFVERNKLMRKEWKALNNLEVSKEIWNVGTLKLLHSHQYQTDFARQLLEQKKIQNIERLQQVIRVEKEENLAGKGTKKTKDKIRPDRGIETMFRITSTNNQRLSDMADNKSNILITVNSIILSVVISLLLRKLDNNEHLTVPTLILLLVSLATMVVAILATRPKVSSGLFTKNDVDDKKVNLLFFGNFYKMQLQEYDESMRQVMEDRDFLYGMLTKDIYSQGVVLGRKYKLLRLAYNIFMFGLIISVLSYLAVVLA